MTDNTRDLLFIKELPFEWVLMIHAAQHNDIHDKYGNACWFRWFMPAADNPLKGPRMLLGNKLYGILKIKKEYRDE